MTEEEKIDRDARHYTKDEIVRINNEIMMETNKTASTSSSLCWLCKHCTGKMMDCGGRCCWVEDFEPVPGWTAKETQTDLGHTSYQVLACPNFQFNNELRWHMNLMTKLMERWCVTERGKPLYTRAITRDPARWIDDYNSRMPRELQIDPRYNEV